jgi:glutaredoxin
MGVPRVQLFTRSGCHLCEQAKAVLDELRVDTPFTLVETDVDSSYALQQAYGLRVPVILVDGRNVSELRIDAAARAALRSSLEGVR